MASSVFSRLIRELFPENCLSCSGRSEQGFCSVCRDEFDVIPDPCPGCGLARPVPHCPRQAIQWYVDGVVAPIRYGYPADHHVQALKFLGARKVGRALGLVLALELMKHPAAQVDALVAVPLHRSRLIERGFNQALEIARPVSDELGLPVLLRGISRSRPTPAQTSLTSGQRAVNLAQAFKVERDLTDRRLAIVDDVITTGATINALGQALRRAGATQVQAWAVARTV